MTSAFRPRRRAASMPGASALLEITIAMLASSLPEATLWAMASKFEPRPERRMPRFFIGIDVEIILVKKLKCQRLIEPSAHRRTALDFCMTLSARNQLRGRVEEIQLGGGMAHIVVRVGENLSKA